MLTNCESLFFRQPKTDLYLRKPDQLFFVSLEDCALQYRNYGIPQGQEMHAVPIGAVKNFYLEYQRGSKNYRRLPERVLWFVDVTRDSIIPARGSNGGRWVNTEDIAPERLIGEVRLTRYLITCLKKLDNDLPVFAKWGLALQDGVEENLQRNKRVLKRVLGKISEDPKTLASRIVDANVQFSGLGADIHRLKRVHLVE